MTFLGFSAKRPELIAESTAMFLRILNYNHVLANHSFSLFQHPHQLSRTFFEISWPTQPLYEGPSGRATASPVSLLVQLVDDVLDLRGQAQIQVQGQVQVS